MGKILINNETVISTAPELDPAIAALDLAISDQLRKGNVVRLVAIEGAESGQAVAHLISPGVAVAFAYQQNELTKVDPEDLKRLHLQFEEAGAFIFNGHAGNAE